MGGPEEIEKKVIPIRPKGSEDIPAPESTSAEKRDVAIMRETLKTNTQAGGKEKIDAKALLGALGRNEKYRGRPKDGDRRFTEDSEKP